MVMVPGAAALGAEGPCWFFLFKSVQPLSGGGFAPGGAARLHGQANRLSPGRRAAAMARNRTPAREVGVRADLLHHQHVHIACGRIVVACKLEGCRPGSLQVAAPAQRQQV